MSSSFSAVNLSQLAPPPVVEELDFEVIVSQMIADLKVRSADFTALLESDPAFKIIEVCAYRELLLRQRVNEACKSLMLAFATGADLDQIGANVSVPRLVVTPANPAAVPPVIAVMETDEKFRMRIQIAFQGFSTAGPEGAYVFQGMSADGRVKDLSATSPTPGVVNVYVLSHELGGIPSADVLTKVTKALNAQDVRPLTDNVFVYAASIVEYTVQAELVVYPGPDSAVILAAAHKAVREYTAAANMLGYEVAIGGLYKALHQAGVQQTNLIAPTGNIAISQGQAASCTAINITIAA
jgi:phage-related baseplate assembly protein